MCSSEKAEQLAAEFAAGIRVEQALDGISELLSGVLPTSYSRGKGTPTVTVSCGSSSRVAVHVAGSAGSRGVNFLIR